MRNINITNGRPEISSEEIRSRRNFPAIYEQYKTLKKDPFYKSYKRYWGIFFIASLLIIAIYYVGSEKKPPIYGASNDKNHPVTYSEKKESERRKFKDTESRSKERSVLPGQRKNISPATDSSSGASDIATAYSIDTARTTGEVISQNISVLEKEIYSLKERINKLEQGKPVKPVAARGYSFRIKILPGQFPELDKYEDVLFEVAKEEKNFSPEFVKSEWNSAKIKGNSRQGYTLTLTKRRKSVSFKVNPVFRENAFEYAMKIYTVYQHGLDSLSAVLTDKEQELMRYKK